MTDERDWFTENAGDAEEHVVDARVRARLDRELTRMDRRIASLKRAVGTAMGERLGVWLELEERLNERAGLREAACYNVGVDEGRASVVADALLGTERTVARGEALRIVAESAWRLAELARRALASAPPVPRVLLVDDDALIAGSVARLLIQSGFEVHTAASARDALAVIERESFDAVVSDYRMPGGDGVSLLREAAHRSPGMRRFLTSSGEVEGLDELIRERVVELFLAKMDLATELVPALRRRAAPEDGSGA